MAYRYRYPRRKWRREGGDASVGPLLAMLCVGWVALYPAAALMTIGAVVGAAAVLAAVWGVLAWLLRRKRPAPQGLPAPVRHAWSQYISAKEGPMSKREWEFYRILENWARRQGFRILANCNLYAVMQYEDDGSGPSYLAWQKIKAKQIDFTCVDAHGGTVWCMELDDSTHDRWHARARDADKDEAFAAAGIPFYRVRESDQLPKWLAEYERPWSWRNLWEKAMGRFRRPAKVLVDKNDQQDATSQVNETD